MKHGWVRKTIYCLIFGGCERGCRCIISVGIVFRWCHGSARAYSRKCMTDYIAVRIRHKVQGATRRIQGSLTNRSITPVRYDL